MRKRITELKYVSEIRTKVVPWTRMTPWILVFNFNRHVSKKIIMISNSVRRSRVFKLCYKFGESLVLHFTVYFPKFCENIFIYLLIYFLVFYNSFWSARKIHWIPLNATNFNMHDKSLTPPQEWILGERGLQNIANLLFINFDKTPSQY